MDSHEEEETIHSGNLMSSIVHRLPAKLRHRRQRFTHKVAPDEEPAETFPFLPSDTEEDEDIDVEVVEDKVRSQSSPSDRKTSSSSQLIEANATRSVYAFGPPNHKRAIAFENTLNTLNNCVRLAYYNLSTPKWKTFKGLKLRWRDRIRLNNVIWRAWWLEFVAKFRTKFCSFSVPVDDLYNPESDCAKQIRGALVEGMYWKRRSETVIAEYKRWRTRVARTMRLPPAPPPRSRYFSCGSNTQVEMSADMLVKRLQVRSSHAEAIMVPVPPSSVSHSVSATVSITSNPSQVVSALVDDDLSNVFTDRLFSSLSEQLYMFPNPKEIAQAGNADFIQPGLTGLQPSMDDIMASLEVFTPTQPQPCNDPVCDIVTFTSEPPSWYPSSTVPWNAAESTVAELRPVPQQQQYQQQQQSSTSQYRNDVPIGYKRNPEQGSAVFVQLQPGYFEVAQPAPAPVIQSNPPAPLRSFCVPPPFPYPYSTALTTVTASGSSVRSPMPQQPQFHTATSNSRGQVKCEAVTSTQRLPSAAIPILPVPDQHSCAAPVRTLQTYQPPVNFQQPSTSRVARKRAADSSSQSVPSCSDRALAHCNDRKRALHVHAEQERREAIKDGFDQLRNILVLSGMVEYEKASGRKWTNAAILDNTARLISRLVDRTQSLQRDIQHSDAQTALLRGVLAENQARVASRTGNSLSTVTSTAGAGDLRSRWNSYVLQRSGKTQGQGGPSFALFATLFLDPLFESFSRLESNPDSEQLHSWVEGECGATSLHKVLSDSLVDLATSTSVITQPGRLGAEVLQKYRN